MSTSIDNQGVECTVARQFPGVANTVTRDDSVGATIYRRHVTIVQAQPFDISDSDVLISDSTINISDTER